MAMISREQILFWWHPTLAELRRCYPSLPERDAVAAIEMGEFVLAVIGEPDFPVWVMRAKLASSCTGSPEPDAKSESVLEL